MRTRRRRRRRRCMPTTSAEAAAAVAVHACRACAESGARRCSHLRREGDSPIHACAGRAQTKFFLMTDKNEIQQLSHAFLGDDVPFTSHHHTSTAAARHIRSGTPPAFTPQVVRIRAGTRPHLRRHSPTSAPGLCHICAGTVPHLRRDSPTGEGRRARRADQGLAGLPRQVFYLKGPIEHFCEGTYAARAQAPPATYQSGAPRVLYGAMGYYEVLWGRIRRRTPLRAGSVGSCAAIYRTRSLHG